MPLLWWMPIGPSSFDQHGARQSIARLGQPTPPNRAAAGMFAWHKAEPGHELARVFEPRDVTDLRREKGARLPLEKWKSIGRLGQPKR